MHQDDSGSLDSGEDLGVRPYWRLCTAVSERDVKSAIELTALQTHLSTNLKTVAETLRPAAAPLTVKATATQPTHVAPTTGSSVNKRKRSAPDALEVGLVAAVSPGDGTPCLYGTCYHDLLVSSRL